jgi:hypothetical protein
MPEAKTLAAVATILLLKASGGYRFFRTTNRQIAL